MPAMATAINPLTIVSYSCKLLIKLAQVVNAVNIFFFSTDSLQLECFSLT